MPSFASPGGKSSMTRGRSPGPSGICSDADWRLVVAMRQQLANSPYVGPMRGLMTRIERIPMWGRLAVLAVAAGLTLVAGVVAHSDDSDSTGDVASANAHSQYLGPRHGGKGWMRSRPKRVSIVWAIGDGADGGSDSRAVAAMVGAQ